MRRWTSSSARPRNLSLLLIIVPLTLCAPTAGQQREGGLKLEPYVFETYDKQKVEAEVGRLTVPENRLRPRSNTIELAFVRFKSMAARPGTPLVFLSGGPGASGTDEARGAAFPLLMSLREVADVIVLDQRGTGMSKPSLVCARTWDFPLDKPGDPAEWLKLARERMGECAREVKDKGVDLGAYNSKESADDVEALRRALGAQKLSLWGVSYGTHLALMAVRRHGRNLDRIILTGVNGPDHLMMKLPSTIEEQLAKLDRLFKSDPKVAEVVPDLQGLLKRQLDRLEKSPVTAEATDPRTKEKLKVALSKWDLQFHTAAPVTQTWGIMGLPAFFRALAEDDFTPLAQRALEFRKSQVGSMMAWMVLSAAGASRERRQRVAREAKETLLGDAINFPFPLIGAALGQRELGPEFRAPVKSRVRALFISGTLDGRTPVANAFEVLKGFPRGEHLVVEGASHGYDLFYFTPQVKEAMIEFLKGGPLSVKRVTLSSFPFNPVNPSKKN
jgi:pimeloyl-ACP methyl ester carboxylesterase